MRVGDIATIGEFTGEVITIVGDGVYLRLETEALVYCQLPASAPPPPAAAAPESEGHND